MTPAEPRTLSTWHTAAHNHSAAFWWQNQRCHNNCAQLVGAAIPHRTCYPLTTVFLNIQISYNKYDIIAFLLHACWMQRSIVPEARINSQSIDRHQSAASVHNALPYFSEYVLIKCGGLPLKLYNYDAEHRRWNYYSMRVVK